MSHRDPRQLGERIADWVRRHRAVGAATVAVLEPGAYQLLHLAPPEVPQAELRTALRWRIKDLINFPADQAVIDLFPVPQALAGRVRDCNVVVAREALVRERIALFEGAGLRLDAIDIGELVHRNVLAALPDRGQGLALLTLDEQAGLITLVRDEEIYLARDLDLGLDALPAAGSGSAQDPAFDRFTLELQRSLDYYQSALGQAPPKRILVHPPGPRTAELTAHLGGNFQPLAVHELAVEDLVGVDETQAEALQSLPAGVRAVGAALRAEAA